jgi:hypothetical protein
MNKTNRWWCSHCQRHGHSYERCSSNPDSINYRPNSSSYFSSLSTSNLPSSSISTSYNHTNARSENSVGR